MSTTVPGSTTEPTAPSSCAAPSGPSVSTVTVAAVSPGFSRRSDAEAPSALESSRPPTSSSVVGSAVCPTMSVPAATRPSSALSWITGTTRPPSASIRTATRGSSEIVSSSTARTAPAGTTTVGGSGSTPVAPHAVTRTVAAVSPGLLRISRALEPSAVEPPTSSALATGCWHTEATRPRRSPLSARARPSAATSGTPSASGSTTATTGSVTSGSLTVATCPAPPTSTRSWPIAPALMTGRPASPTAVRPASAARRPPPVPRSGSYSRSSPAAAVGSVGAGAHTQDVAPAPTRSSGTSTTLGVGGSNVAAAPTTPPASPSTTSPLTSRPTRRRSADARAETFIGPPGRSRCGGRGARGTSQVLHRVETAAPGRQRDERDDDEDDGDQHLRRHVGDRLVPHLEIATGAGGHLERLLPPVRHRPQRHAVEPGAPTRVGALGEHEHRRPGGRRDLGVDAHDLGGHRGRDTVGAVQRGPRRCHLGGADAPHDARGVLGHALQPRDLVEQRHEPRAGHLVAHGARDVGVDARHDHDADGVLGQLPRGVGDRAGREPGGDRLQR